MFLSFLELHSCRSLNCGFETTWSWINNSIILIFWGWTVPDVIYHPYIIFTVKFVVIWCNPFAEISGFIFWKSCFTLVLIKICLQNMSASIFFFFFAFFQDLKHTLHSIETHFLQQGGWGCCMSENTSSLELAASRLSVLVSPSSLFLSLADDGMWKQLRSFAAAALMGMHGTGPGASLRYELNHWAELNGVRNGRLTLYMG